LCFVIGVLFVLIIEYYQEFLISLE